MCSLSGKADRVNTKESVGFVIDIDFETLA